MSKHPAARALQEVARDANLAIMETENFQEVPGKGVTATVAGKAVLVGRDSFLKENRVDVSVVARTSFAADGGPDFRAFDAAPFWFAPDRKLSQSLEFEFSSIAPGSASARSE